MNPSGAEGIRRSACLFVVFFDNLAIAMVIPWLSSIAAHSGAEPGRWVYVLVVNGVFLTIAPFFWGRWITPSNAGEVTAMTLVVKALCTATLVFAFDSWVWLLVNRAISGAMSGTTLATRLWLVTRFPERASRSRCIAAFSMAVSAGIGLGALLAAPFLWTEGGAVHGIELMLIAVAAVLLATSALAYLLLRDELPQSSNPKAEAPLPSGSGTSGDIGIADAVATLGAHTLSRVCVCAYPSVLLLVAEQDGRLTEAFVAMLIGLLAFFEIPGQFLVSRLILKFGYRSTGTLFSFLCGVGVAIPFESLAPPAVALSAVLVALMGGSLQSVLGIYLTELKAEKMAPWFGASQGMTGAARTVAPLAASLAFSFGTQPAFLVLVVPMLLAFFCIGSIQRDSAIAPDGG
jgi:MFS family permease